MLQHPNVEVEKETVRKVTLLPLTEEQFAFAGHTQSIIDERGSLEVVDIRRNEYT